jgi:phosphatidylserine synthase
MSPALLLAWLAHAYTALGLVCAAGIAASIVAGGDESFRVAFLLMIAATFEMRPMAGLRGAST